jgi:hypothetical protein
VDWETTSTIHPVYVQSYGQSLLIPGQRPAVSIYKGAGGLLAPLPGWVFAEKTQPSKQQPHPPTPKNSPLLPPCADFQEFFSEQISGGAAKPVSTLFHFGVRMGFGWFFLGVFPGEIDVVASVRPSSA